MNHLLRYYRIILLYLLYEYFEDFYTFAKLRKYTIVKKFYLAQECKNGVP